MHNIPYNFTVSIYIRARCIIGAFFIVVLCGVGIAEEERGKVDEQYSYYGIDVSNTVDLDFSSETDSAYFKNDEFLFFRTWLQSDLTWEISANSLVKASMRVYGDNDSLSSPNISFLERENRRPRGTFREVYFRKKIEDFKFDVGKQIFSWGLSDINRPMDSIFAHDTLYPIESFKIGNTSLSLDYEGAKFYVQGLMLGNFAPSRQPYKGRWLIQRSALSANERDRIIPSANLQNLQYGLRIGTSSLIPGWDLELGYFYGFDTHGSFALDTTRPTSSLSTIYPRYHQLGAAFSTVLFDEYVFYGEGVGRFYKDQRLEEDYINYTLGVRRVWEPFFSFNNVSASLEYAEEKTVSDRKPSTDGNLYLTNVYRRAYEKSVSGRLEVEINDDLKLETTGMYTFPLNSYYWGMEASYDFNENFTIGVGVLLFGGEEGTLFNGWKDNDLIYINVETSI